MHPHRGQTMTSQHTSIKNIALVGVTGVGKSTLVNVLVGAPCAKVNNDVEPCTTKQHSYNTEFEETIFTLWDTRGLNEPRENAVKRSLVRFLKFLRRIQSEDQKLQKFLCGNNPAIDLVLFCIEAKDIMGCSQWKNYCKVYNEFCKQRVKIVVVVTKLKEETHKMDLESTCMLKAKEVVKGSPNLKGFIASVPEFPHRPAAKDMQLSEDCRNKILKLISDSIR